MNTRSSVKSLLGQYALSLRLPLLITFYLIVQPCDAHLRTAELSQNALMTPGDKKIKPKAQNINLTITGKVLDSRTHLPLRNLWMIVKGTVFTSVTDSLGRFKFQLPDSLTAKDVFIAPTASTANFLKSAQFNIPSIKVAIDDFPFKKNIVLYRYPDSTAYFQLLSDSSHLMQELTEDAEFPGGRGAMLHFVDKNIHYPQLERDNDIQGTVTVEFMIDENGEIKDLQVIKKISPGLDKEASRVIKMMPRWRPSIYHDKPVRVYYVLPVEFKIRK